MPILDRRTKQLIEDKDTRVSVGIDFPFARVPNQDGYFKTTKTITVKRSSRVFQYNRSTANYRLFSPAKPYLGNCNCEPK